MKNWAIIIITILISFNASAWKCIDGHGSSVEVVKDERQIYGGYWDALIIVKGPVVDYLFEDAQSLERQFSGDNRISSMRLDLESGAFEIMARGFQRYHSFRCGRFETCVRINRDWTGVKLFRYFGNNDLSDKGNWYFGICQ